MRVFLTLLFFCSFALSHGIDYAVKEGRAIIINAKYSEHIPVAYAKIEIYKGDSAIPLISTKLDSNGNFAFVPTDKGQYGVKIVGTSDHGDHISEFKIDIDDKFELGAYDEPKYQKYTGILSVLGIIFGLFGLISMIKSRKV